MNDTKSFGPASARLAFVATALAVALVGLLGRLLDGALGGVSALHLAPGVAVGAALAWGRKN